MVAFNPVLWRAFDPDGNAHDYCRRPENVCTEVAWATADGRATIHHGDCLDVMRSMPDGSVDAVVTDPPYALTANKKGGTGAASVNLDSPYGRARIGTGNGGGGFMGQAWDASLPPVEAWAEALRVARPGAHLLAFGGTRTFHRLACAIEDAGWEIRDCIVWVFGSGFPKSHNGPWGGTALKPAYEPVVIARKPLPIERELASMVPTIKEHLCAVASLGQTDTPLCGSLRTSGLLSIASSLSATLDALSAHASRFTTATAFALTTDLRILKSSLSRITRGITTEASSPSDGLIASVWDAASLSRSVLAKSERLTATTAGALAIGRFADEESDPADVDPDAEFVVVARKPLIGTVAANHAAHGTGALNIDGCRIAGIVPQTTHGVSSRQGEVYGKFREEPQPSTVHEAGRWPANVALDDEAARLLDEQSGERRSAGDYPSDGGCRSDGWGSIGTKQGDLYADAGGASRFFYTAKASRSERNAGLDGFPEEMPDNAVDRAAARAGLEGRGRGRGSLSKPRANTHPTVKPVDLMRWLVRLVTPLGGTVLDPFLGSGTTLVAALQEGCKAIGIEREAPYVEIAKARVAHEAAQGSLFK